MMNEFTGKVCPFCKTQITADDEVKVCPICDTLHHKGCWEENKGCTTFGCSEQHYEPQGTNISDICTNCGAPLGDGQNYCPKCGTIKGASKANACSKCGATLQEGQAFCSKCGQKVGLLLDSSVATAINQANAQITNKNKKRIVIPIVIVAVLAIAVLGGIFVNNKMQEKRAAEAKETYLSNVRSLQIQLLTAGANLEDISDTIQNYWYENIYNDKYGYSIDSAIAAALSDKSNEIKTAEEQRNEVDDLYKKVKSLPTEVEEDDDLKEARDAIRELYNTYTDFYSFATSPAGNFNTYSANNEEKTDAFLTKYRALENLLN